MAAKMPSIEAEKCCRQIDSEMTFSIVRIWITGWSRSSSHTALRTATARSSGFDAVRITNVTKKEAKGC